MIVVYHGGCVDGFCAAWAVALSRGDERRADLYVPAAYGDPLPDGVDGQDVVVVDFSYPRPALLELEGRARTLRVLDHHKTARVGLEDLPFCLFDESRSGARMAWDLFLGDQGAASWLVRYVEDRDLWRWALPDSREVSAAIAMLPRESVLADFDAWASAHENGPEAAAREGAYYLRADRRYVERAVSRASLGYLMHGQTVDLPEVPIVCETHLTSEVLHALGVGYSFAVGWSELAGGRFRYSLRSAFDGADVSEVAKLFGGGGHVHAAGFESDVLVHRVTGKLVRA